MQTEDDGVPVTFKKKNDKGSNDNITVSHDKTDTKKGDKSDGEDPKPRIVLTFRSEKSGAKTSNMKIVPNDEKLDEFSPRRSSRTRGKWEWSDETDASISPKKEKNSSQSVSENDETSDSSPTASKRTTRRRSKDSSDNVLANATVKKEKSLPESSAPTQRLSRRIKPTAKILANEELRIGLESQNNARLGIQTEKTEEGVRTRRSARPMQPEAEASTSTATNKKDMKNSKIVNEDEVAEGEDSNLSKQDSSTVMKLKHLCELGLKAINTDSLDDDVDTEEMEVDDEDEDEEEEEEEDEEEEDEDDDDDLEEDEIEDDSEEVISKLLEADEDSSEDFLCTVGSSRGKRQPRRSTRLCSSYGGPDGDQPSPVPDDNKALRRSPIKRNRSRRRAEQPEPDQDDDGSRSRRLKRGDAKGDEVHSEMEQEDNNSEAAGGDEGAEAACPEDESVILATCFCETPSNVHAAPSELTEPVFCQAVESVDGVRVGCSHAAGRERGGALSPLLRAGPRAPFLLTCRLHAAQLRHHMCCPACGLFCTQGIFYQCSVGHLFHLECGLPYNDVKQKPGCPHCGLRAARWQPANTSCSRVRLLMRCSNKRVLLPDQREQCTQAYLTFSSGQPPKADQSPLIPDDLYPLPGVDLAALCRVTAAASAADEAVEESAQNLCDAIMAMEPVEQLLPKITSRAAVRQPLASLNGGTSLHCAAAAAHTAALHLLHAAGGGLDATDLNARTPLIVCVQALLDKPENQSNNKSKKSIDSDPKKDADAKEVLESKDDEVKEKVDIIEEEKQVEPDSASEKKDAPRKPSDEDLMNTIKYLVAAGCDVNIQGAEGMTALHTAAQHGSLAVCSLLLDAGAAAADPRDHGGWTPLVWAAENKHTACVRLLLEHGADAATSDLEGNGAVHWCALAGDQLALKLLLDRAPAAAHALNAHRDTPLHVAARQGHYACVIILLARGAKTDVENAAGELAVDVCSGACQRAVSLNMQMARVAGAPRCRLLASDISMGREPFPVPCVNELDAAPLPADFSYVTRHVLPAPLAIDNTLQTMQGCDCKDGDCSSGCSCCALSVRRWWARGRLPKGFPHHDPPMLFECNDTCSCDKRRCVNMVVSRLVSRGSLGVRCEVFRAGARGWGLRAAAAAARGAAVAVYTGELLALPAADTRPDDRYMFALDLKPDLLEQCSDKTLLCVDASRFGGAARFINHSCRANLAPVRVFPAARDLRLPTIALVATRDLRPGDELTFDYGDKFWSVKSKFMKCECGTPECRYPEKSPDSDA